MIHTTPRVSVSPSFRTNCCSACRLPSDSSSKAAVLSPHLTNTSASACFSLPSFASGTNSQNARQTSPCFFSLSPECFSPPLPDVYKRQVVLAVNNSLIPAVLPKSVRLSSCYFHALRHTPAIIRAGRISCFSQPVCYLRSLFYHT